MIHAALGHVSKIWKVLFLFLFFSMSLLLCLFVLPGHVGVSGLQRDKVTAGAAHDPQRGANANRFKPTPGGQSQQAQLPSALRGKPRSPSRRHTFNGTATSCGDEFNTAPSDFFVGASAMIGMPSSLGVSCAFLLLYMCSIQHLHC